LVGLLRIITPLLLFFAEEVYENISFNFGYALKESVLLLSETRFPFSAKEQNLKLIEDFLLLRQDIFLAL